MTETCRVLNFDIVISDLFGFWNLLFGALVAKPDGTTRVLDFDLFRGLPRTSPPLLQKQRLSALPI